MRLCWLTDIHLNFLDIEGRKLLYQEILNSHCNALLISGDIAEAPCLVEILNEMVAHINIPIYFVLGNHDYYRGQINEVREAMIALTSANNQLFWLPASGKQILNKNTILVGQDGWADGRLGDYQNSRVGVNDSRLITDLFQSKILGRFKLLEKMQQLADADAMQLEKELIEAANHNPKKIIVLTHVPPFKDACMYEGKMSDDNWLPFFSSKVMGDVLIRVAEKYFSYEFVVLCGHTHGKAKYKPLNNLTVKVGNAEYYRPEIQELIIL